jgi:hypothetical protein
VISGDFLAVPDMLMNWKFSVPVTAGERDAKLPPDQRGRDGERTAG